MHVFSVAHESCPFSCTVVRGLLGHLEKPHHPVHAFPEKNASLTYEINLRMNELPGEVLKQVNYP